MDPSTPRPGRTVEANREKRVVALTSVLAAILLTGAKLTVGLLTGSLGILAEAAHSGLDLAAALLTLFAVRFSARGADDQHTYGYGKIENLSALFETLLLLGTCVWIIFEAIERLTGAIGPHVSVNAWSFLVILLSILVDISRSRALYRVAKKFQSQALEADALHFTTDILSSLVVLGGLLGMVAARAWNTPLLERADSVAALGVAAISIGISWRIGMKTISDLLDQVPPGLRENIAQAARKVAGVLEVRLVRIRRSGPEAFADVTVAVAHDAAFEYAHEITSKVEEAVRTVLGATVDVVVHAEPTEPPAGNILSVVQSLATRQGLAAHSVHVLDEGNGRQSLELHLEVVRTWSVGEAHAKSDAFEAAVHGAFPSLLRITTHLEPAGRDAKITPRRAEDDCLIREAVEAASQELGVSIHPHNLEVSRTHDGLAVAFHCLVDPAENIDVAHDLTKKLERSLRTHVSDIASVVIHVEPREVG